MKSLSLLTGKNGMNQKRLAEILGLSTGVLNRYLLDTREPGLDSLRIINQAEAFLKQAQEKARDIQPNEPSLEEQKKWENELENTKVRVASIQTQLEAEKEKVRQIGLVLAWLDLWAKSPLHPLKPWSDNFLKAQKGFSSLELGSGINEKILAFDLRQAEERLHFLENLFPKHENQA